MRLDTEYETSYFRGTAKVNDHLLAVIDELLLSKAFSISELVKLPLTTSTTAILQARALTDQILPSFLVDSHTRDYISLFLLHQAITNGCVTGYEGYGLAVVGALLVAKNRLNNATAIGHLAITFCDRFNITEVAKSIVWTAACIFHWTMSFEDSVPFMKRALKASLEAGDVIFATLSISIQVHLSCYTNSVTKQIAITFEEQKYILGIQNNQLALNICEAVIRPLQQLLTTETIQSLTLARPKFLQEETDNEWEERVQFVSPLLWALYKTHSAMVSYIMLDNASAILSSGFVDVSAMHGYPQVVVCQLYRALSMLRVIRNKFALNSAIEDASEFVTDPVITAYFVYVNETIAEFTVWCADQPINFEVMLQLLRAELLFTQSIKTAYESSVRKANNPIWRSSQVKLICTAYLLCLSGLDTHANQTNYALYAIIYECYARCCLSTFMSREHVGKRILQQSLYMYGQYRAEKKIKALSLEFPSFGQEFTSVAESIIKQLQDDRQQQNTYSKVIKRTNILYCARLA